MTLVLRCQQRLVPFIALPLTFYFRTRADWVPINMTISSKSLDELSNNGWLTGITLEV